MSGAFRWRLLAALPLGALATLPFSFEIPALAPLVPVALAALLRLALDQPPLRAALLGWCWGFGFFAAGVYWVVISTHGYGGAPLWLGLLLAGSLFWYLSLYPALALGLAARFGWLRGAAGWVALPAAWIGTELLRGWIWSGFPWLSLGYATVGTPLASLAPLAGVTALSGLLVLAALALLRLWIGPARAAGLIVLALVVLAGLVAPRPSTWTQPQGEPLDVAIVQGNIGQDEKWLQEMQLPTLQRYHDMTLAVGDADLVVWPEVALTYRYEQVREPFLEPLARKLAARGGTLITGIVAGADDGAGFYNSLVAMGAATGRYDKRHLVPFGEFFPIPDFLKPLMQVLGTPYADFLFGAAVQVPIVVHGQRLGVSICFEDAFGDEIRVAARDAGVLVNLTNDAWFGRSPAARQHLQIARMRALETGRMTVRAANTGISAFIGPDGELVRRTGHFTTETLRAPVQPRGGVTPYVRWGDAPLWWGSTLAVALACGLHLRRRAGLAPVNDEPAR